MKKLLFLILTLAIPVSIFLFLKIFGNNEFEVPILYENGIPGCEQSHKPHKVPSVQLSGPNNSIIETGTLNGYLVYGFLANKDSVTLRQQIIQLVRIQDAFYEIGAPTFVLFTDQQEYFEIIQSESADLGLLSQGYHLGVIEEEGLHDFLKCGIGLDETASKKLVLIDTDKFIRGIYDGLDMKQTEQLILELKILRQQA